MENNTNKSQAEAYREERKARLAKAAEKNAKKSPKAVKAKKLAGKIAAIVLAVIIGLGAIFGTLNFFGVPEKVLKVSVAEKDYSFTLGEFNYYYLNVWSNFASQAYQYSQYGMDMGYDVSKKPASQEYLDEYSEMTGVTVEQLGVEEPTWEDLFKYLTVSEIVQVKYMAQKAGEAGLKLSEEETKSIDTQIEEVRTQAKEDDYSLNRFLRASSGNGVTEKLVRRVMEETYLASAYMEKLQKDLTDAVTDEQINTRYNENRDDYDIVDARVYSFTTGEVKTAEGASEEEVKAATDKAYAETKSKADAFLKAVTDEASFIKQAEAAIKAADADSDTKADESTKQKGVTYADLSATSEELAKWAYDDARAVGDKTVIDAGNGIYTVILMTATAYKDTSVYDNDVRHILVKFPTDENGETAQLKAEEKTEYKNKAQAILDEYLKNPTEDNFIRLAKEKSEDEGSKADGGLIAGITETSSYVENFLKWSVDPARKAGDTGIVETEYGYHIMYYSQKGGESWYETVRTTIANENYTAIFDEVTEKYIDTVNIDSVLIKYTLKRQNKIINNIILNNFAQ